MVINLINFEFSHGFKYLIGLIQKVSEYLSITFCLISIVFVIKPTTHNFTHGLQSKPIIIIFLIRILC